MGGMSKNPIKIAEGASELETRQFFKIARDRVQRIQRISTLPMPVPFDVELARDSFKNRQNVIDFLYEKSPGEWPDQAEELAEIHGEWIRHNSVIYGSPPETIIYQLHGGGYLFGSASINRNMARRLSKNSNALVFTIDYRLSPQNPYPCPVIDAVSGYLHIKEKYPNAQIIIEGDSAGGNLTLATAMVIRDMGIDPPIALYLISPWTDLTHSQPSFIENANTDYLPLQNAIDGFLPYRKQLYTADCFLKEDYISPLWAKNLTQLPPMLIQCGGSEMLRDEVIAFATLAFHQDPTNQIILEEYLNNAHVFQLFYLNKGAVVALKRAGDFIRTLVGYGGFGLDNVHSILDFNGKIISSQPHWFTRREMKAKL